MTVSGLILLGGRRAAGRAIVARLAKGPVPQLRYPAPAAVQGQRRAVEMIAEQVWHTFAAGVNFAHGHPPARADALPWAFGL